jgi:hypothetical protein
MVVPVTSARRGLPSHVEIDSRHLGLDEVGHAECEDLKSISDRRLVHCLGAVDSAELASIERALRYLLELWTIGRSWTLAPAGVCCRPPRSGHAVRAGDRRRPA